MLNQLLPSGIEDYLEQFRRELLMLFVPDEVVASSLAEARSHLAEAARERPEADYLELIAEFGPSADVALKISQEYLIHAPKQKKMRLISAGVLAVFSVGNFFLLIRLLSSGGSWEQNVPFFALSALPAAASIGLVFYSPKLRIKPNPNLGGAMFAAMFVVIGSYCLIAGATHYTLTPVSPYSYQMGGPVVTEYSRLVSEAELTKFEADNLNVPGDFGKAQRMAASNARKMPIFAKLWAGFALTPVSIFLLFCIFNIITIVCTKHKVKRKIAHGNLRETSESTRLRAVR